VKKAADRLVCSSVLLVNVTANHPTKLRYNWMYVYDKDKYCTRINCTELLSPNNAPAGQTGVQVEVYFSKYKPLEQKIGDIAEKVKLELVEMGLIDSLDSISDCHTKWVPWANVVFDQHRKSALDEIFNWLLKYGLKREDDDIDPMTDWVKKSLTPLSFKDSNVILSGRFAQWKYYWSDDCVMRGKFIAEKL
jgi:protoporphyrinogen oxidase